MSRVLPPVFFFYQHLSYFPIYVTLIIHRARKILYTDFVDDNSCDLGKLFKGMKPLLAPKDNLCLFYYHDNRALAYDIGGFFCRKINNIRNELEIVKTALKEDDKVKYDPEVMEIYIWVYIWYIWVYIWYIYIYIYEFIYDIYMSLYMIYMWVSSAFLWRCPQPCPEVSKKDLCPQPNTKAMVVTRVKELLSGKTCMLNSS